MADASCFSGRLPRNRFIDDFCTYVIEESLVKKLPTLFTAVFFSELDAEERSRLAAEMPGTVNERKRCVQKLAVLERGMADLRKLSRGGVSA